MKSSFFESVPFGDGDDASLVFEDNERVGEGKDLVETLRLFNYTGALPPPLVLCHH